MRVIYSECSEQHLVRMAEHLQRNAQWEPIVWLGSTEIKQHVMRAFPNAIFHSNIHAARGISAEALRDMTLEPLDLELLISLRPFEVMALKMMERMDPDQKSFSYDERLRHYHHLVRYWRALLLRLEPDVVFFSISPHLVYDLVLFALCKELDIRTIMFERTAIPGRLLLQEDWRDGSEALKGALRKTAESIELSKPLREHVIRLRGEYSEGMPANYRKKLSAHGLTTSRAGAASSFLRIALREGWIATRNVQRQGAPQNYLKLPNRRVTDVTTPVWRWQVMRIKGLLKKSRLRRRYETLQEEPDYSRNYVFLALHYQPERNTLPLGADFANMSLVIDILSHNLPTGWLLYVKEHAWQLQDMSKGQMVRDLEFYDRPRRPNVRWIPISTPSFDLIDHSQAVATIAGSAGWEAVLRGKPALVFGAAWYLDAPGVLQIRSNADSRAALEKVAGLGVTIPTDALHLYLGALDRASIVGYLEPRLEDVSSVSEADAVSGMAGALAMWAHERVNPK